MIYKITPPEQIHTTIQLPASKSISNRALILNALAQLKITKQRSAVANYVLKQVQQLRNNVQRQTITNLSDSDDTRVLYKALQSRDSDFDIGAAGTSMRFLTAYLSQLPGEWTITGSERMKNRPIRILVDALRTLGAKIDYLEKDGFPPLKIYGRKLRGGELSIEGGVSSQYISALMMIAPCMAQGLILHLTGNIISQPYIQMTRGLMQQFGVSVTVTTKDDVPAVMSRAEALSEVEGTVETPHPISSSLQIKIAPQPYTRHLFCVESDWSAASYWYEIRALMPEAKIELLGLEANSLQGDAAIEKIMSSLPTPNSGDVFQYDFVNEPDLAQTVVVTCCLLNRPFRFSGLQSLRIKETDRMLALQTELKKLGYILTIESDSVLLWNGERCEAEPHSIIDTYEDHRMAMAFAPACLTLDEIRIADPSVVTKSYPNFWEDLKKAGFQVIAEDCGTSPQ